MIVCLQLKPLECPTGKLKLWLLNYRLLPNQSAFSLAIDPSKDVAIMQCRCYINAPSMRLHLVYTLLPSWFHWVFSSDEQQYGSSMDVLRQNKMMWRLCGIYLEDGAPATSRLFSCLTNVFVTLTAASYTAMSVAFIVYADKSGQIEQIMYAVLQCANGVAVLLVYLTLILEKRNASKLTKSIQTLVNERECEIASLLGQMTKF